ncbi:MAG: universal stress protein [Synechococcales cyanobacterium C42_A2020_086]|jgi:nucleotide-binding universal stress UspA family protein|nr:universal stress protein [Synechococcales cyanobacterium C42_A2020_086]
MFTKILVALDQSDQSQGVFTAALELAKSTGAQLMLLHVLSFDEQNQPMLPTFCPPYFPIYTEELAKYYQAEWERITTSGLNYLNTLAQTARAAGVAAECQQVMGDPSRAICAQAREWSADLIVIGRRGHSGLSEWLLGSVSNYVLHHAPCAVLTVQGVTTSAMDSSTPDTAALKSS